MIGSLQKIGPALSRRAQSLVVLLAMLFIATAVHADRASGTWTGELQLRGNYYWEQSTRVVSPTLGLSLEAPSGVRVHGDYLVDSITSASQAAGVLEDVRFTEIRHAVTLGGGYEWDLGAQHFDLSISTHLSKEPDYLSLGVGLRGALSLNSRATILSLSGYYLHDSVRQVLRSGAGIRPGAEGGTSSDAFRENFDGLTLAIGWEQILTPQLYFQLEYQFNYLDGYLSNPYRQVVVGGALRAENHPGMRQRHTLALRLAYHFRPTRTSFHALVRGYADNWEIRAITPEIRVYQEVGSWLNLRARWRHYQQSQSYFYADEYTVDLPEGAVVSADPKMSGFHSNLFGMQALVELAFLEDTPLNFLSRSTFDLSFEYIWNTNRFGNGVIMQAGLHMPF